MSLILRKIILKTIQRKSHLIVANCGQICVSRRWYPSWGPPKPIIDKKEIEFRVFQSLAKHDKIDLNSIKLETNFQTDMGLDSLDLIECIVELEDEFNIEVNDRDLDKLVSVKSVVEYLFEILDSKVDQNQRPDIEFKEGMTQNRPVN